MQKLYQKDQETIKSFKTFHKNYGKSSQSNVIDKNEYESLCNSFTEILNETTIEFFL